MIRNSNRIIPLIITVGQVAVFPYYIIWLKEVTLTFTLFAWLFAVHSFSAAWGYRVFQLKKNKGKSNISLIYLGMGCIYLFVGLFHLEYEILTLRSTTFTSSSWISSGLFSSMAC